MCSYSYHNYYERRHHTTVYLLALHVAIAEGHMSMVEFLLRNGADVNLQEKKGGFTPIMLCLASRPVHYLNMIEVFNEVADSIRCKTSNTSRHLHPFPSHHHT
jgi:ankyrin repeat protein